MLQNWGRYMRKTSEAHLQNRRAFTLVELMVAILILLIGVTSIPSILPLAFHIQRNSKDVIMSEILARNASSMLSARKIKYSDLRKSMLTSDLDVFQPMDPLNYPGSTSYRSDGKDSSSKSGNALLYADTGRMAVPLPNGRVNTYGEVLGDAVSAYRDQLKTFILSRHDVEVYDETIMMDNFCYPLWGDLKDGYGRSIVYHQHAEMRRGFDDFFGDTIDEAKAHQISRDKAITDSRWTSLMEPNDVRLTTGGKNDFDERAQGYGLTGSTSASRDRSRHLWGYNKSQNMMATYDGTGTAPAYLWTIRDRSLLSLSKKKIGKRDYFWVLFDADPRPGRFEWRAYVVVTVRFPGHNYKYQGQVHTDHGTSVQAFAANPRDPDTVPRVTAVPMDMANSDIRGCKVQRYSGGAYGPLNYVYYPDYPDTSSTATIQSSVSRGYMSKQDDWEITGPNDPVGQTSQHHGYVSGRFIPGDKFEITVNQPNTHYRDFQSNGWVLAGSTPTFLLRANNFTGSNNSAIKHPVPYWESHYNPRNSSFKMWTWMHNNGVGNISVGRIMPVSGLVVDMGD